MKPDAILVQPRAGRWDLLGTRIPESLLAVANLPSKEGYNIQIIDQRTDHDWAKRLSDGLKKGPLCVGVTAMTGRQIHYALSIAKLVKEKSDAPVIWGGVHPSLMPQQTMQNKLVDVIVQGEGDLTFLELLQSLEKNKPLDTVRGIWHKKGQKIKSTAPQTPVDLNALPEPPYHLLDLDKYTSLNFGAGNSLSMMTSRGCPFRCAFCYNTAFHKQRWNALSAENTLKRIKTFTEDLKIRTIFFEDDNFCGNLGRFREIVEGIIREGFDITWGTMGIRANTILAMDKNLLHKVEQSGCRSIDIGVESGSSRILKMVKKDVTTGQIIAANKKLSRFPFVIKYTFVAGFPTETKNELGQSAQLALKLAQENRHAYTPFFMYTPYPGTELFELALSNGFKPPANLEGWGFFSFDDWFLKYPSWLSEERVKLINRMTLTSLFANQNTQIKVNTKLMKLFFKLYHPVAKYRFTHGFYNFPVDINAIKYLSAYVSDKGGAAE